MFEILTFFAFFFGIVVLVLALSVVALLLKLLFKIAVIPLKLAGGLLVGALALFVLIPLTLFAVPVAVLAIPALVVVAVICSVLCVLAAMMWLGFHTLAWIF